MGSLAMVLVWIVALLVLFGTAFVIVVLVEAARRDAGLTPTATVEPLRTAAEDELELRYVRGEIDAATLARHRATLRHP